jgi:hypothetical protein
MPSPRSLRLTCKRRSAASIINQGEIIILDSRVGDAPNAGDGAKRVGRKKPLRRLDAAGERRGERRRARSWGRIGAACKIAVERQVIVIPNLSCRSRRRGGTDRRQRVVDGGATLASRSGTSSISVE